MATVTPTAGGSGPTTRAGGISTCTSRCLLQSDRRPPGPLLSLRSAKR